jgi:glycosyltransferase involved in cell wall biosynthesis
MFHLFRLLIFGLIWLLCENFYRTTVAFTIFLSMHMIETLEDRHKYLSIVVPCFNEEESLLLFYEETAKIIAELNQTVEFIFVDDGSKDKTLEILRQLASKDKQVHYVSFSRNFGKEAAMLAGLEASQGKYIVMLDADLQHPPSLIPEMLKEITNEEYDCVVAKRTRKGDPILKTFLAKIFYRIISVLAGIKIPNGAGDFRLMTNAYVKAILRLEERNRFSKGIYPWIGFRTKYMEYENVERVAGITKWSFFKLFSYSLDGITAFSTKLLSFAAVMGIISSFASIIIFIMLIIRKLFLGVSVDGWTTIVCLIVFFSGVILLSIGILGQYMAKMYTEIKHRPHFIVKEAR